MPPITPITLETVAETGKVFDPVTFTNDQEAMSEAINTMISTLEDDSSGTSGAEYVQCRPVGTLNAEAGGSIYTLLLAMFNYIGEVQSGTIADESIEQIKLAFDVITPDELASALAGVQLEITGGASTIIDTDLTASRILVSDALGKVAVSALASSLLSYLSGLTGNVQTQINAKQASITVSASKALVSDSSGKVAASAVTATELGYVDGVTSPIQTQLDGKISTAKMATGSGTSNPTPYGETNVSFGKTFASPPVVCCNSTGVNSYTARIKSVSEYGFVLVFSGGSIGYNYIAMLE